MNRPIHAITLNQSYKYSPKDWWTVYENGKAVHSFPNRSDANILAREMENGKTYEEALKVVTG